MVYSSTIVTVTLSFHDKNINRTKQSSQKVRITGAVHSNRGQDQFLVEGHFGVLMQTILQHPPGSSSQATIRLDGWMRLEHQLEAARDWLFS